MKATSEGINDLMLLGLDNFFSENVDNDIDGATDNATLEEVQDFSIKLGIKPLMHLLEISTLSLNNVQNYEQNQQKLGPNFLKKGWIGCAG